jgi:hypothetical protein
LEKLGTFITKDVSDEVDQSLSGENDSLFGDWTILIDVLLWDHLILTLGETIINMLSNLERFVSE